MIHANRIVTVGEQESIIDRPIVLYRGDREVEIEFTLVGNEFTFSEDGNVIKSVNASHGQLVLNTPSGEHMFSELAECHEGKVVFVVTKEMIDEFIEMGFYSFQIRLYDSAEMKSRVTIPPVLSGFDIRNPIAAEDETNVVDQGIVDYARIFKDQSNEELPTFTWDGEYVKTEWVHHDVITENKMNKIEDALYSINANIKESDVVMLNTLDNVKKDADAYVKEHMAEVEADAEEFERNINSGVEKFKVDTNAAMTAHKNEVSEELESFNSQLTYIENRNIYSYMSNYKKYEGEIYDTERLQRALDDCSANGKILVVNENLGLHLRKVDGKKCCVIVPSNTKILGIDGVKIKLEAADDWTRMFFMMDVENIVIENLSIDGNRYNVSDNEQMHIFYINGCYNVKILRCHLYEARGDAILVRRGDLNSYSQYIIIDNCIINSCGRNGITLGSGYKNITITNCHFYGDTLAQHIDSEPESSETGGVYIANNILDGTEGGSQFTLVSTPSDEYIEQYIVENNIFLNSEFFLNGAFNSKIINNCILSTTLTNLYNFPIGIRGRIDNLEISGNKIVYLNSGRNTLFSFESNTAGVPQKITVSNNRIVTDCAYCFEITKASDVTIMNNEVEYTGTSSASRGVQY